jgi:hypothetical protein
MLKLNCVCVCVYVCMYVCMYMCVYIYIYTHIHTPCIYIQGVSRLYVITAGGDLLGLCDEKSSYKHVTDFGRLRSYGRF